jgi:hypothetical protein
MYSYMSRLSDHDHEPAGRAAASYDDPRALSSI